MQPSVGYVAAGSGSLSVGGCQLVARRCRCWTGRSSESVDEGLGVGDPTKLRLDDEEARLVIGSHLAPADRFGGAVLEDDASVIAIERAAYAMFAARAASRTRAIGPIVARVPSIGTPNEST
jgi:hypothetical protein